MSVEVKVISKQMVKPSSPTPQHLRHYHLSFIDQFTPQINNSMVYFFHADDDNVIISDAAAASDRLKKSLSKLLTHFYPLAGRLKIHNLLVDCSDEGVPYVETKVNCHLGHIINNPLQADVSKLLPYDMDEAVDTVLGVQFNVFDCGGFAIGVSLSHKVADALSYFTFIKSWAAVTRGEQEPIRTRFQSTSLFPSKDLLGYDPNSQIGKHKFVGKRFIFEESVIESLRTKYSKMTEENILEGQKPLSRFETLSTFLFNRFIAATKKEGDKKIYQVASTVNLRKKMEPPLPEYAFGNYYWYVVTFPSLDEKGECDNLGRKLREEVKKIDNEFFVKLRESKEWNSNNEDMVKAIGKGELVTFNFTSLCRFPIYEVDFGWGSPTWIGPPTWKFKNVIAFKDTKLGGGIEAYVTLTEDDMAKFECNEELLAHASTIGLLK